MTLDTEALENVIGLLNQEVFDQIAYEPPPFHLMTTGDAQCVMFFGENIWCSENDDRMYDEPTDSFAPIEEHLRTRAQQLLKKLCNIHLINLP